MITHEWMDVQPESRMPRAPFEQWSKHKYDKYQKAHYQLSEDNNEMTDVDKYAEI